jgi:TolB protein
MIPYTEEFKNTTSHLTILDIKSKEQSIILTEGRLFEAPNWSRDGNFLIINSEGKIEKIGLNGEKLGVINTDFADHNNNDHLQSWDGKSMFISHHDSRMAPHTNSRIFQVPMEGGVPRLITENFPSYLHGVSPDDKRIVYTARRNDKWNIWTIAVEGGEETQLTFGDALDDGPEYSYDGAHIYFNSHRSGRMHLYRMNPDGSEVAQLTHDDYDNWFPHPSPDGTNLVYISYLEDQKSGHPFGKDVKLRIMDVANGVCEDLTEVFYGGQGSINVPSWSPDGKKIAFVKYQK